MSSKKMSPERLRPKSTQVLVIFSLPLGTGSVTSSVRSSYVPEGSRCPTADLKMPSKVDASNGLTRLAPVARAVRHNASSWRTPGTSISE